MTAHRKFSLSALIALDLSLFSCGDDGADISEPAHTGSVRGTITELDSGAPVTDAGVLLLDPDTVMPASDVTATNSSGTYRIHGIDPGSYAVVVFHDSLAVFDRTASLIEVEAGRSTVCDVRVHDSRIWDGRGYHIAGTVRDAETGAPVRRAFVEQVSWANQDIGVYFIGLGVPFWAVTDSTGHFDIEASRRGPGFFPITVTAAGYEPSTLAGLPLPDDGETTLSVEVHLRPLGDGSGPRGSGAIGGRVTFLGDPVPNLKVGLSIDYVADADSFPGGAPVPLGAATTDANGRFLFSEILPGSYGVQPGFLVDDGYTFLWAPTYDVFDGDTTDVGDVAVEIAIQPEYPEDGSTIRDATPEFRWGAVPDTSGYRVFEYGLRLGVDTYWLEDTYRGLAEPAWQVPDSLAFEPGSHVKWSVFARAAREAPADTVWVAESEVWATFTVE